MMLLINNKQVHVFAYQGEKVVVFHVATNPCTSYRSTPSASPEYCTVQHIWNTRTASGAGAAAGECRIPTRCNPETIASTMSLNVAC